VCSLDAHAVAMASRALVEPRPHVHLFAGATIYSIGIYDDANGLYYAPLGIKVHLQFTAEIEKNLKKLI
jgi:hypothetical protein